MRPRLVDALTEIQQRILGEALEAAWEEGIRTLELHKADNPESETGSLSDDADTYLRLITMQRERLDTLHELLCMLKEV